MIFIFGGLYIKNEKSIIFSTNDNKLLEHELLKWDLKHFKEITSGKTVVMGWNTFESIGCKPLPNRYNIIISNKKYTTEYQNIHFMTYKQFIEEYKNKNDIFIIGGIMLFNTVLKCNPECVDEVYITKVYKKDYKCTNNTVKFNIEWLNKFVKIKDPYNSIIKDDNLSAKIVLYKKMK